MGKWYKDLFEGRLGRYWLHLSDKRKELTDKQVSFLRDILRKGYVLDHCCGPGRLSIPLSSDRPVVGLDLSKYLLTVARNRGKEARATNLHFIRADMRHLPLRSNGFDNIVNLWTSFGYFSNEENELVLKEIVRVLKTDGIFVIDTINPEWLIRNFREKDWDDAEEFYMLKQRFFDWENKRMKTHWIFINKRDKEISEINFDHRIYSLQEFKDLYVKLGLSILDVYSSFTKDAFDQATSNRMIIVSEKSIS